MSEVLDSEGMFELAYGMGDQVKVAFSAATERAAGHDLLSNPVSSVIVLGMGGSAVAGDVLSAVASPRASVPILVGRHYELPAFVAEDSLVFAVSFSGNTEETVGAARMALERGAQLVAVTRGGALGELASNSGALSFGIDPAISQPRAAIGALSVPLLVAMESAGLCDGLVSQIAGTVDALDRRIAEARGGDDPMHTLARRIEHTQPLIFGGGALGAVAAVRTKNQINENAKSPAYANVVPELCHNEICAWGQHGDVTRQVNTMLYLRHDFEHPQVARRFEYITSVADEVVADIHSISARGDSQLAQLFDLILQGDLLSLWMAAEAGVDPGPVPTLVALKEFLVS